MYEKLYMELMGNIRGLGNAALSFIENIDKNDEKLGEKFMYYKGVLSACKILIAKENDKLKSINKEEES